MKKISSLIICTSLLLCSCSSDDISPTIVITNPNLEIEIGNDFNPLDYATANDDVDGDLTNSITVKSNDVNTDIAGTYTVVFEVKDKAKNTTQSTLSVNIKEGFSNLELGIISAVKYLHSTLKDPESLQLNSLVSRLGKDGLFYVEVDYSARNGFGGLNRDRFYISLDPNDPAFTSSQLSEFSQIMIELEWGLSHSSLLDEVDTDKILTKIK